MTTLAELADQLAALAARVGVLEGKPAPTPTPAPSAGRPATPTGLACAIGPDGRPDLRWDPAAGVTAWEVHDVAAPAPTLRARITEPRTIRSALKPGQHRRYAVLAVGLGGRSDLCEPIDVPPADEPAPEPTPAPAVRYPADLCGKGWYLTLPVGTQGDPDTVHQPDLGRYASKYFDLTQAKDGIIFRVWHGGVTTKNSPNPRSELRECNPDGSLAWWPLRTGRHAMTVTGQVNRLTKVHPHVVLAQCHGRADDTTVWRIEGTELWITDGDNTHAHLVTSNLPLGTRYTLATEFDQGTVRYRFNGDLVPFQLNAPQDDGYWKVGCYAQTNPKSAPDESTSEFDEVLVFSVAVTHTA